LALLTALVLAGCRGSDVGKIRHAYQLGRSPSEPNKNRLAGMLKDPNRDVRAAVLVVMDTVDPVRARDLALKAIDDPDGAVRTASVRILAAGVPSDLEIGRRLAIRAGDDADWQVRREALEAIAALPDDEIRDAVAKGLADSADQVRGVALRLGVTRPGILPLDKVGALILEDPSWENRIEAARVLGASKDPAAYAPLDQAAADGNEFVRAAAMRERRNLVRDGVPEPVPEPPPAPPTPPAPKPAKPGPKPGPKPEPKPEPPAEPPPATGV
jgi:HEAT repeat protein